MAIEVISIHPGVVDGRRQYPKANTCANSSLVKRLTRQLAGLERHVEQNPRDAMSVARIGIIKSILRERS